MKIKIPEATIVRLSRYSRYLSGKRELGIETISSDEIAHATGAKPSQVRKDLAYFGDFGIRGVGYDLKSLNENLLRILNLELEWGIALVGFGNLGHALASYNGFLERSFVIRAIFDKDPKKTGTMFQGIEVSLIEHIKEIIRKNNIKIAIIATPTDEAQDIVNLLIEAGILSILNFAPISLKAPKDILLRNVDLSANLELLAFNRVSVF